VPDGLVPMGVEHVQSFTPPRLLAAAMRLLSHAESVSPGGEPLDLIVVGVPASVGDEIREVVVAALHARADVRAEGYRGDDIRAEGERLTDA
jgi:hypothetical protein